MRPQEVKKKEEVRPYVARGERAASHGQVLPGAHTAGLRKHLIVVVGQGIDAVVVLPVHELNILDARVVIDERPMNGTKRQAGGRKTEEEKEMM